MLKFDFDHSYGSMVLRATDDGIEYVIKERCPSKFCLLTFDEQNKSLPIKETYYTYLEHAISAAQAIAAGDNVVSLLMNGHSNG